MKLQMLQRMDPATNVKVCVGYIEGGASSVGIEMDGIRFVASRLPFIGPEKKIKTLETLITFVDRLRSVGINVEDDDILREMLKREQQKLKEK